MVGHKYLKTRVLVRNSSQPIFTQLAIRPEEWHMSLVLKVSACKMGVFPATLVWWGQAMGFSKAPTDSLQPQMLAVKLPPASLFQPHSPEFRKGQSNPDWWAVCRSSPSWSWPWHHSACYTTLVMWLCSKDQSGSCDEDIWSFSTIAHDTETDWC